MLLSPVLKSRRNMDGKYKYQDLESQQPVYPMKEDTEEEETTVYNSCCVFLLRYRWMILVLFVVVLVFGIGSHVVRAFWSF